MAFDVTTVDIENLWRPLDTDESDVGTTRLEQAQRLLRVIRPGLEPFTVNRQITITAMPVGDARTEAQARLDDLIGTIKDVLCEVVIRFLQNPDRYRQQSIGAGGDVSIGYDVGGREARGGIYFTDAELSQIDTAVSVSEGVTTTGAGSRQLKSSFPYRVGDPTILPIP